MRVPKHQLCHRARSNIATQSDVMQQFAGLGFVKVVTVKPYSDFYVMG